MKKLLFILATIFLTLSSAFAETVDNSDVIWVWDMGEMVALGLNLIYAIIQEATFEKVVYSILAVAGFLMAIFQGLRAANTGDRWVIVTVFYIIGIAVVYAGFLSYNGTQTPQSSNKVYILNMNQSGNPEWTKCHMGGSQTDCYAPWGIKFILTTATNIERATAAILEKVAVMMEPAAMNMMDNGFGYGFEVLRKMDRIPPANDYFRSFQSFIQHCTMADIQDGLKSIQSLKTSKDLETDLLTTQQTRFFTLYKTTSNGGVKDELVVCNQGRDRLKSLWTTTCEGFVQNGHNGSNVDNICSGLSNFTSLMLNTAKDANFAIQQAILIKLTNTAFNASMAVAGLDPRAMAGGVVTAEREQLTKWMSMGIMAQEYLPIIRGIMNFFGVILCMYAGFAFYVVGMRAINAAVVFWATMIVWTAMLECVNLAGYFYAIKNTPGRFLAELGSTGTRDTILTHGAIMDEVIMVSGLLGYFAIGAFALARMMVANQGSQITGAFSGAISGLGLSAFAVRSAAQGKIETPLGSVGPEGATGFDHLSQIRDKIAPEGPRYTYSTNGVGAMIGTTTIDGQKATNINTGLSSLDINSNGKVGNAKFSSGLTGTATTELGNMANYQHKQSIAKTEEAAKLFTDSVNNVFSAMKSAGTNTATVNGITYTHDDKGNEIIKTEDGLTFKKDKSGNFVDVTRQYDSAAMKTNIGGGANSGLLNGNIGLDVSVGQENSHNVENRNSSGMAKAVLTATGREGSRGGGSTENYGTSTSAVANDQISAAAQKVTAAAKSYNERLAEQDAYEKVNSMSKAEKEAFSTNLVQKYLQDKYDEYLARSGGNREYANNHIAQNLKELEDAKFATRELTHYMEKEGKLANAYRDFEDTVNNRLNTGRADIAGQGDATKGAVAAGSNNMTMVETEQARLKAEADLKGQGTKNKALKAKDANQVRVGGGTAFKDKM